MQAGILSANPAAISTFVRVMEAQAAVAAAQPQIIQYPATTPRVAVACWHEHSQPVRSASRPDGTFIVVAGDLYNRDEIADRVRPGRPAGTDDASLILDLYLSSGPTSLAQLNAAATVTIWDAARQDLMIFRDRWGQASQFYAADGDRFLWAADLRTLLLLGVSPRIDADALDFFLAAGYFPAPWTGLTEVKKIPPAHVLSRRHGGTVDVQPFWRPTGTPKTQISAEQTTERLQTLLAQSLRRRHRVGTRTGVFLSGGVDSALLVGILTRLLGVDIDTFTFRYSDYEGVFNESRLAEDTAKHFGTRHHTIEFSPYDLADSLDRMVLAYEEPFTFGLHSYLLADVVRSATSTVLSGAGVGDWYAGRKDLLARRLRMLPLPFHAIGRVLDPLLGRVSASRRHIVRSLAFGAATGLPDKTNEPVGADVFRRTLYQDARRATGRHRLRGLMRPVVAALAGESTRDQVALLTQRYFIAECNLYWYSRWGKAWKIRVAHPYYDNDLQDFAMRLERNDRDKPEMRRVAERLMPRSMAYAPKISQTVPIRQWFRGPLLDMLRSRLAPHHLAENGTFDPGAVHRLIDQHVAQQANHEWLLWSILTTTVWQDVVLRQPRVAC